VLCIRGRQTARY